MGNRVSSKLSRLYQEKHEQHFAYLRSKGSVEESDLQTLMKNLMTMNVKRYEKYLIDLLFRNYASLDDDRLEHSCLYKATEAKFLLKSAVLKHLGGRPATKTARTRPAHPAPVDGCYPLMSGMLDMILADIEQSAPSAPQTALAKLQQLTDLATSFIGSTSACSHNKAVFSKLLKHYLKLYKKEADAETRRRHAQHITALSRAKLDLSSQIELIYVTRGDPNFEPPADLLTDNKYKTFRAFELKVKVVMPVAELRIAVSKYRACFWSSDCVRVFDVFEGKIETLWTKVLIPADKSLLDVTFDSQHVVLHLLDRSVPADPFVTRLLVDETGLQTSLDQLFRIGETEVDQHHYQHSFPATDGYLHLYRREDSYLIRDALGATVASGQTWFDGCLRACSVYGRTVVYDCHRLMDLATGRKFEPIHEVKGFDHAHQLLVLSNPSDPTSLELAIPLHLSEDSSVVSMYNQVDDQPVDLGFIARILQDEQAEEEVKRLLAYILYRHTSTHAVPQADLDPLRTACSLTSRFLHSHLQAALLLNLLQLSPVDCSSVSPLADDFDVSKPNEQLFELVALLPSPVRLAAIEKVLAGLASAPAATAPHHLERELRLLLSHLLHDADAVVELVGALDRRLGSAGSPQQTRLFVDSIEVSLLEKEVDPKQLLPQIPNFIQHMQTNHETACGELFTLESEPVSPKPDQPECLLLDPFKVYEASEELDLLAPELFNTCVYSRHEFVNKYLYCRSRRIQGAFHLLLMGPKPAVLRARPVALQDRAFCHLHLFERLLEQLFAASPSKHQQTRWKLLASHPVEQAEPVSAEESLCAAMTAVFTRICAAESPGLDPSLLKSLQMSFQQAIKANSSAGDAAVRANLAHLSQFSLSHSGHLEQRHLLASFCHDFCQLLFGQTPLQQLFQQEQQRLALAVQAVDLIAESKLATSCYMKLFRLAVLHLHGESLSPGEVAALEGKVVAFLGRVSQEVAAAGSASIDARFDKLHFLMVRTDRVAVLHAMLDVLVTGCGLVDQLDSYSLNSFLLITRNLIDLVLKALRDAEDCEAITPDHQQQLLTIASKLHASMTALNENYKHFDVADFEAKMAPVFERASKLTKHLIKNEPYPHSNHCQPELQTTISCTSELMDNYMSDNDDSDSSSSSQSGNSEENSYEDSNEYHSDTQRSSSGDGEGWVENNSKASATSGKSNGLKIVLRVPSEMESNPQQPSQINLLELGTDIAQSPLSHHESLPKQDVVPSSVDLDEMVIGAGQDSSILKVKKPSRRDMAEDCHGGRKPRKPSEKTHPNPGKESKPITLKQQEASCLDSVIFRKIESSQPQAHQLLATDIHKLTSFLKTHIPQLAAVLQQQSLQRTDLSPPEAVHPLVFHRSDLFAHPFELIEHTPTNIINNEIRCNILDFTYKSLSEQDFPDRYKFNTYLKKCVKNSINGDLILVSPADTSPELATARPLSTAGLSQPLLEEVEQARQKVMSSPSLDGLHGYDLALLALHFDCSTLSTEDLARLYLKLTSCAKTAAEFVEPIDMLTYLERHKAAAQHERTLRLTAAAQKKPPASKYQEFRKLLKGSRVDPKPPQFPTVFPESDQNFYNPLSSWMPTVSPDLYMSLTYKSTATELLSRVVEHEVATMPDTSPPFDGDFHITVLRSLVRREQLFSICRDSSASYFQLDQRFGVRYSDILLEKLMRYSRNKTLDFFSFGCDARLEQLKSLADPGVQPLADLDIHLRLSAQTQSPKQSLKLLLHLFDCIFALVSMDLERDIIRKSAVLKLFEWYHATLQTLDSDSLLHALDSRLEHVKQLLSIYCLIDYGGYMKGQVCLSSYVEGVLHEAFARDMLSAELLDEIDDSRIRLSIEELRRATRSLKQAKASSFEEYRDELIRGILLMKLSCEKPTKLEGSTTHVLYPRIPVKVSLENYSNWAMTNIKSFGDTTEGEETSGDIILQIQDADKQVRQLFYDESYNFTLQCFELNVKPGIRAGCHIEDPPIREHQVTSPDLVLVRPALRHKHFALNKAASDSSPAPFTLNHKLIYLLNNYFDASSLHPTLHHSEEGTEFSVISGVQFSDFSLLNENRASCHSVSRGTLLSYLPATNQLYLNCPFDSEHLTELKVSCVDDRIDESFYPLFGVVKKIERVCQNRYLIRHSDNILVLLNLTDNLTEKNKIVHPLLLQQYEDKLLANNYDSISSSPHLTSKKKAFFRETHYRQNIVLDITKDRLVDYACGAKVVVLVLAPADQDRNLISVYPTESVHRSVPVKRVPILKMKGYDDKKKKAAVVLYADGRVGFISFNPKLIETSKFYIEFADDYFYTQVCAWHKDWILVGRSRQAEEVYAVRHLKSNKLEDHEMNQVLSLDRDSQVHDSSSVLATGVGIKKECIFNEKYYHLAEYPLLFYLDLETDDLVVRDLAGNPDFYREFVSHDLGADNMCIMLMGPTLFQDKQDPNIKVNYSFVKQFLLQYKASVDFMHCETGEPLANKVIKDWNKEFLQPDCEQQQKWFSDVDFPRVLIRFQGRVKADFQTLVDAASFSVKEKNMVSFDVSPNVAELFAEDWSQMKAATELLWKPVLDSLSPADWFRLRDALVHQTWSPDEDEDYYIQLVSGGTSVMSLDQNLKNMIKDSFKSFTVEQLYSAHCALAITHYKAGFYMDTHKFVGQKPVSFEVDEYVQNIFGTVINNSRSTPNFTYQSSHISIQVDRYRAEAATKEHPNMGFLNQLYYQLMVKSKWKLMHLFKMSGIELKFAGEDAYDAGGLLKEYFSGIAPEVTKKLDLFIRSPNFGEAVEENDRLIPNPAKTTNADLNDFKKFGFALGMAFWSFSNIGIDLPSSLWRYLHIQDFEWKDFRSIDARMFVFVESLQTLASGELEDLGLTFTHLLYSTSKPVELKAGGSRVKVTADNVCEYVARLKNLLVKSVKVPYEYITLGFQKKIIPSNLAHSSPKLLETAVTGCKIVTSDHSDRHRSPQGHHDLQRERRQRLEHEQREARQRHLSES